MQSINFNEIRSINNGQQDGFEEFVCQLASNMNYEDSKAIFIDNNGAGGDGGVECFWRFENGEEYGWQAKYFLHTLNQSQWNQIKKSFDTAIKKHPTLTKYYVCIPRELNNSMKTRNDKPVNSERDNWIKNTKMWKENAKKAGKDVEIILWDENSMSNLLLKDKRNGPGMAEYWFNKDILTMDIFKSIFLDSKDSLGPRYSEENNIDLPINEKLNILSRNDKWYKKIEKFLKTFLKINNRMKYWKLKEDIELEKKQELEELKKITKNLYSNILEFPTDKLILFKKFDILNQGLREISENLGDLILFSISHDGHSESNVGIDRYELIHARKYIQDFIDYINSNEFAAGKKKLLMITGIAGSGKSHLLCDFSKRQLEAGNPVLFLLGQHYMGGSPITFLAKKLEIADDKNVLPALSSMGFTMGKQVVIVIDAINEGNYNYDWPDYLSSFILKCKDYSNISLVFSCRDTYASKLIPSEVEKRIPMIKHTGFSGNGSKAARQYLKNYNINAPDVPFLAKEFTNPLFLRLICQSMKDNGEHNFPVGILKFEKILSMYRNAMENRVRQNLRISSKDIISMAIDEFVSKIYPNNLSGISYIEAYEIFKKYDTTGNKSLLEELISEGLLDKDNYTEKDGSEHDVIRFTFERFSDYYISEKILSACKSINVLTKKFFPNEELGKLLINGIEGSGILEVLCIEIPNKFGCEVNTLIDWGKEEFVNNHITEERFIENFFLESLISRNVDSFSDNTFQIFNQIKYSPFSDCRLDVLIRLSLEKNHPLNADFLDKSLIKMTMPERDNYWSTYIAIHENYGSDEGTIRNIIQWAKEVDFNNLDTVEIRLLSEILLWFTTTVNRTLRQHAIQLLGKAFTASPEIISEFVNKYSMLDDSYLVIGLYNAVYGAILHIKDTITLSIILREIPWDNLVKTSNSNILVRDCLTGIYNYCRYLDVDTSSISIKFPINKNNFLPDLDIPSQETIDLIDEKYSSIKSSVMGGLGDFGKYSMSMIDRWSATKINEYDRPKTEKEYAINYFESMNTSFKAKIDSYIKKTEEINSIVEKSQDKITLDTFIENMSDPFMEHNLKSSDNKRVEFLKKEREEIKKNILDNIEEKSNNRLLKEFDKLNDNTDKRFDKSAAERWVVKRSYELGWRKYLFENFESMYCGYGSRNSNRIERIGKKYQWISLYELLAVLSEKNYYLSEGYSDIDDSEYRGVWQFDLRDFDPTNIILPYDENEFKSWCDTPEYTNFPDFTTENQSKWVSDGLDIDLKEKLNYIDNSNGDEWISLFNYENWSKVPFDNDDYDNDEFTTQLWYRISSIIVRNNESENIIKNIGSSSPSLMDPYIVDYPNNQSQEYLWEYPWFDIYPELTETESLGKVMEGQKYLSPIYEYFWSTAGQEHTLEENISYYLPNRKLVKDIDIENLGNGKWGKPNDTVFFNRVKNDNSKNVLIKKKILLDWLSNNNLRIIWFAGGEKSAYNPRKTKYLENIEFDGMFYLTQEGLIKGSTWQQKKSL